jgi:hypothetical protein
MSKGRTSPTTDTIAVPEKLCRLLMSDRSDFKEPAKYDEAQSVAKALLKVLVEMSKVK